MPATSPCRPTTLRRVDLFCLFLFFTLVANHTTDATASDVRIENAYFTRNTNSESLDPYVVFTVTWDNAWHNERNHDAAWVFMKLVSEHGGYRHLLIDPADVQVVESGTTAPLIEVAEGGVGLFVSPASTHRGSVRWRIKVRIDANSIERVDPAGELFVGAIEMVYVPKGAFTLGDPDPASHGFASFFKSDADGNPDGLYTIASSDDEIRIGPQAGSLYYNVTRPQYQGDQTGVVPAAFPKGFDAFYIMKYETRQGQYAEFLNTLSDSQSQIRAPFGGREYYRNRGTIGIEDGHYFAKGEDRPANYISWDDGAAFADWAGLRPMTELEFTKAARGPSRPLAHEYPWNTDSKDRLQRFVNVDGELVLAEGLEESQLTNENRDVFGASYYWVMDLAGSVWEKCVTIGDEKGRAFKGTHGDGMLSGYGAATNADWPHGIDEEGGYGYRGGGYYYPNRANHEFNPHSPIAYRTYGSWAGGTRSIAYSNRYARTAPAK